MDVPIRKQLQFIFGSFRESGVAGGPLNHRRTIKKTTCSYINSIKLVGPNFSPGGGKIRDGICEHTCKGAAGFIRIRRVNGVGDYIGKNHIYFRDNCNLTFLAVFAEIYFSLNQT